MDWFTLFCNISYGLQLDKFTTMCSWLVLCFLSRSFQLGVYSCLLVAFCCGSVFSRILSLRLNRFFRGWGLLVLCVVCSVVLTEIFQKLIFCTSPFVGVMLPFLLLILHAFPPPPGDCYICEQVPLNPV